MTAMLPTFSAISEQLITAVVPPPSARPAPEAALLPMLPDRRLPIEAHHVPLLDLARLDRSGRVSARALLKLLGWRPGHRLTVDAVRGALVLTPAAHGAHLVGSRCDLALPFAPRTLCGISDSVVVAAYPAHDLMVVHPVATVALFLRDLHASMAVLDAG